MNDLQHNIIEKDISTLFGFEEMSDEEKAELLDNIGSVILESATLRFMAESEDADIERFETLIEAHAEQEDMLQKLIEAFPRFSTIVEEEVVAFKTEAMQVLGDR